MDKLLAAVLAANASFQGLAGFKPAPTSDAPAASVAGKPVSSQNEAPAKNTRTVRVSGQVNLSGRGHAGSSNSVYLTLTGSLYANSDDRTITTGYATVNASEFFW